jgi:hypothetical protein
MFNLRFFHQNVVVIQRPRWDLLMKRKKITKGLISRDTAPLSRARNSLEDVGEVKAITIKVSVSKRVPPA